MGGVGRGVEGGRGAVVRRWPVHRFPVVWFLPLLDDERGGYQGERFAHVLCKELGDSHLQ